MLNLQEFIMFSLDKYEIVTHDCRKCFIGIQAKRIYNYEKIVCFTASSFCLPMVCCVQFP